MSDLGLYVPGHSLIHRMPAWTKLLALVLAGVCTFLLDTPIEIILGVVVVLACYALAGFWPVTDRKSVV